MHNTIPAVWVDFLDAEELFTGVRALGLLQDVGAVSADEARAWRKAIVAKRVLPLDEEASA